MALLLWGRSTEPFLEQDSVRGCDLLGRDVRRNRQDGEGQAFALALWKSSADIPYNVPVKRHRGEPGQCTGTVRHLRPLPSTTSGLRSTFPSAQCCSPFVCGTTASCFESAGHTHSRPPSSSELTTGSRVLVHCPPCPHIKGIGSQRLAANVSSTANCGTSSQASCVASSSLYSAVSTHR